VYVVNNGSNSVSVIATATNTVVGSPIPVGSSPTGIAITPDGAHVYVANLLDGTVSVIATATNTVVDTFPVGSSSSGQSLPLGVAITPDGSHVYVANLAESEIDVIATATNMAVATIPVSSETCNSGPFAVAITPDGTHAYVLHASSGGPPDCPSLSPPEESVLVIDTANNTLVGSPIAVGTAGVLFSYTIGITPDGTGVYVPVPVTGSANVYNNTVAVISTASNTETATVTVGNGPIGVAFAPAVLFSAFSTKLNISSAGFDLNGTFTLGTGGSINPPTQTLTLQVGTYTVTVPAGSFKAGPKGTFTFEGTIGGVALQIRIAPLGGGSYQIQLEASGVNLTGVTKPVAVTLSIGDNRGATS
jgi:YVTN family beta-propeller protein